MTTDGNGKPTQRAIETAGAMLDLIIEDIIAGGVDSLKSQDKIALHGAYKTLQAGGVTCDDETIDILREAGILPAAPGPNGADDGPSGGALAAEISRLAALSQVAYDRVREWEAKRLGMRMKTLDDAVKEFRCGREAVADPVETDLQPEPSSHGYIRPRRGQMKSCTANAYLHFSLESKEALRPQFNEFTGTHMLNGEPVTDSVYDRLVNWLEGDTRRDWRREHVKTAVRLLCEENSYDPLIDYFNALVWDGTERIDGFLANVYGVQQSQIYTAISRAFLIQAVARALSPGCRAHSVLLIIGPQGIGKSYSVETLSPRPEWFSDSLGHDLGNKDAAIDLRGKWIVEFPEFTSFRRSELNAAKAFISRSVDTYRVPYGITAEGFKRRSVFVTTTNDDTPLTDITGNRRWWPVRVQRSVDTNYIADNRDQIWAEAAAAYKAGENWIVPGVLEQEISLERLNALDIDDWTEAVLASAALIDSGKGVSTKEIQDDMRIPIAAQTRGMQMRIGRILLKAGYKKAQTSGPDRTWRYSPAASR